MSEMSQIAQGLIGVKLMSSIMGLSSSSGGSTSQSSLNDEYNRGFYDALEKTTAFVKANFVAKERYDWRLGHARNSNRMLHRVMTFLNTERILQGKPPLSLYGDILPAITSNPLLEQEYQTALNVREPGNGRNFEFGEKDYFDYVEEHITPKWAEQLNGEHGEAMRQLICAGKFGELTGLRK